MSGIVSLCSADMHLPCSRACCRFWPSSIDVLPLDLMVIGGGRGGFERTLRHKNHAMRLIAHRLPSQFFFIALSPLFIKLDFYRGKNSSCNLFVIARTMDRSSQLLSTAFMAALSLAYYNAKQDCHQLPIVKDQMQLVAAGNNYIKSFLSCKLYSLLRSKKLPLC